MFTPSFCYCSSIYKLDSLNKYLYVLLAETNILTILNAVDFSLIYSCTKQAI